MANDDETLHPIDRVLALDLSKFPRLSNCTVGELVELLQHPQRAAGITDQAWLGAVDDARRLGSWKS
jgi:hypothetical protein